MPAMSNLLDRDKGMLANPFAPASDGMRDHFIRRYSTRPEKIPK